ncbi:hypothetical protein PHSY_006190 [Pseudozyma hubeiensis SY62]|uniref:Galactose oxidase n=1 Tax=Pseudozyma hubeiensis (strain SY62) TaxID=1305764 RepID=R9PB41_PSEHS|nr:hypothetical protein PHSY_006190 [Pseudozyma hubeiensis SY62]GAC98596.1 hypothetical protein PHSY_006190 [Pseudozyma hubeiensis SY62]
MLSVCGCECLASKSLKGGQITHQGEIVLADQCALPSRLHHPFDHPPPLAFRFIPKSCALTGPSEPFSVPTNANLDFSDRLDELTTLSRPSCCFLIPSEILCHIPRSRFLVSFYRDDLRSSTIPTLLINLDDAMAAQTRQPKHARRISPSIRFQPQEQEFCVEETLASSSRVTLCSQPTTSTTTKNTVRASTFARQQQHLPPRTKAASPKKKETTNIKSTPKRGMWMLRSFLVLVLLVPYVSALPKVVPATRRSTSLDGASARDVLESRHSHSQQARPGYSGVLASAQSGHLDRSGSPGKQRDSQSKAFSTKSRLRRANVFPTVVAVNSTASPQDSASTDDRTLTIVFEQSNGTESNLTVAAPPTKRWGQTATYLPGHNVVVVVGGQTSLSGAITNDVYALDVSELSWANMTGVSAAQKWQRLSTEGLPAHAYAAASAVTDAAKGTDNLWIVGGVTENCAMDAPAYVWSAPAGNITAGRWAAVYPDNGVAPSRRRGAKAVTLSPSANATASIMVSGGTFDATTCASTNGTYQGIDMWSQSSVSLGSFSSANSTSTSKSIETAHIGVDVTGTAYASIQSLALDQRMHDFSLTDYTTAVLPANGTCGEKVLFLGGKDQSGRMARLDKFWALDVATGDWESWNATGLIPSGRMGHTAVVTSDGKVLLHGGYLQDPSQFKTNNDPIGEVFILDPHQAPARWDAASWTSESSKPPSVAYHSSVMAGQVMVSSFGRVSDGPSFAGQSFLKSDESTASPVYYLDTSTMQNAGGFTWSTSTAGVAQARQAVAATVGAADAAAAPVAPAPAPSPGASSAPTASASPSVKPTSEVAAPTSSAAPSDTPAPPQDNQSSSGSNHTGAIAGSLLGAAAIAAAIGGIYAYRKRKEAEAYNLGRQEGRVNDLDRFHRGGKDEETPYVSNLHLSEMHNIPAAAAAGAAAGGWGARLKRAASGLTKTSSAAADVGEDKYTASPKDRVTTMRSTPPRAATVKQRQAVIEDSELPDDFITSLVVADDEPVDGSFSRSAIVLPTTIDDDEEEKHVMMHSNISRASLNSLGSGSAAAASHFSYPYLSGMHRGSSPHSFIPSITTTTSPPANTTQRVRVILGTPDSTALHLSPGDHVSPFHLPQNPYTSPESLCLDFDSDTTIAFDGVSSPTVQEVARTPLFPWSTPVIASPAPAKLNTERTMLRSKPTILHVANK